ncbi:hypothetical protein B0H10DRAFT_1959320 [Mycena sp. CBHHK59/15]|nr:hypothetical protein B0H10DRAFT_1959320 [Mycena sp. CBHHK59/15]
MSPLRSETHRSVSPALSAHAGHPCSPRRTPETVKENNCSRTGGIQSAMPTPSPSLSRKHRPQQRAVRHRRAVAVDAYTPRGKPRMRRHRRPAAPGVGARTAGSGQRGPSTRRRVCRVNARSRCAKACAQARRVERHAAFGSFGAAARGGARQGEANDKDALWEKKRLGDSDVDCDKDSGSEAVGRARLLAPTSHMRARAGDGPAREERWQIAFVGVRRHEIDERSGSARPARGAAAAGA